MTMTRELADGALDALALLEASVEDNPINRDAILAHTELSNLVPGLIVLGASLRKLLADAHGCDASEIDTLLRHWFIAAGDAA